MAYQDLKKIFHQSEERAASVLKARLSDATAKTLPIDRKPPFFFLMVPEIYELLLNIEHTNAEVVALSGQMPMMVIDRYFRECMIEELIITNDIEGVSSSRKEIEEALEALKRKSKKRRFQGIVNNYSKLYTGDEIALSSCEDIRALYDDLVLDEVLEEDPKRAPDGKLFRLSPVNVVDSTQRAVHSSNYSESQIVSELSKCLDLLGDDDIHLLVRVALFHFLFGYIHPFYDGNGRTNRFISSYLITRHVSRYAGLRLSYSVKENIGHYYKAFTLAEHPLNKGDLTPFVITFLQIVSESVHKTYYGLNEKRLVLNDLAKRFEERYRGAIPKKAYAVGQAFLEASLFTNSGVSVSEIAEQMHISIPTVHKYLKLFQDERYFVRKRIGKKSLYTFDIDQL